MICDWFQNLTEFNTAHNRRISMLGIPDDSKRKAKRKQLSVTFNEEEEIINPEDIDPFVGRFRNLVHTTVIPSSNNKVIITIIEFSPHLLYITNKLFYINSA
jgi:hypothetical protein